jgi:ribonuclease P protein component
MVVVVVGKKVLKKAVERNKLKRRLREIFKDSPTKGIIYAKNGIGNLDYDQLKEESKKTKDKLN